MTGGMLANDTPKPQEQPKFKETEQVKTSTPVSNV
jgi:hypothetical protein